MRPVSEREFINYVRGIGGYVTYSDAALAVQAVFQCLKAALRPTEGEQITLLFPQGLNLLWEKTFPYTDSTRENETPSLRAMLRKMLGSEESARKAIIAVFGAFKEKLQEQAVAFPAYLNAEGRFFWSESCTVDSCQDAGQFL